MQKLTAICLGSLFALRIAGNQAAAAEPAAAKQMPPTVAAAHVEYNRDIRPILSDKCFRCHGPDAAHREAELRLDLREQAVAPRNRTERDGATPIVPGKASASEVLRRLTSADPNEQMPPPASGLAVGTAEIELLRRWIDQGAEYQPHWAFVPPKLPPLPQVQRRDWPRNPIDYFVLAKLEAAQLQPSPEASRETWLRRVTLDLTGLPPTLAELDAFLADKSPDAHEKVVDRLLASPRYGERLALDWLDGARYADTNGYYTDAERVAWPWRDWVIRAFNADRPFDQFTVEQLAGDLLPQATLEQKIATGFNRMHMVTNETGIIDEEYRTGYVVDRVDTTTTVWLGLTMACARCHDHKYDPLTQREYYELFACFNNVAETGLVKEVPGAHNPPPLVSLPTAEQERRLQELAAEQRKCEANLKAAQPALAKDLAAWEPRAFADLAPEPTAGRTAHFRFDGDAQSQCAATTTPTTIGKLQYVPGAVGRASQFDGTQYVEFDGAPQLRHDRPFSFAAWIAPGGAPSGCVVSKMDADAQSRGFDLIWYKSQPRVNLVSRWGESAIEVVAQQKFSRAWHHLAVTYDGSGRAAGVKMYVDGAPASMLVRRDDLDGPVESAEPWRIAWKATGVGFEGGLDEVRFYERLLAAQEVEALYWRDFLGGAIALPTTERTKQQQDKLQDYYIQRFGTDELRRLARELTELRDEQERVRSAIASTAVMQDLPQPRETHVLVRGQYDQPGERVRPGVPAALGKLPAGTMADRLALARWLVSDENPLTARVAVNRYWNLMFGEGLVRTLNDFGSQGELPTHPELLDWLAVTFMRGEGGRGQGSAATSASDPSPLTPWNVKRLVKLIALSAVYRQSSNFTPTLLARDPENRLLARGPRYRLSAETIRDQALAAAGLLVERVGGPSVKPYQPPGVWEAVSYNGDLSYVADRGEGLYRRSLYTFWKRQSPPPSMAAFDAPTREVCTVRRPRTNTPLQALGLLNDVTFVEAGRRLAQRLMREASGDEKARISRGFRVVTGRDPDPQEAATLHAYYVRQVRAYRAAPEAAQALLAAGESPVDPTLDPCELAAWAMTAGVLLNLDEVVTQH